MRMQLAKVALLLLVLSRAVCVWAQTGGTDDRSMDARVIRVVRDPHNGMRWLLERGTRNPGGPGRMILLSDGNKSQVELSKSSDVKDHVAQRPVIRSGDRLVVEERSPLIEARLEAISLGAAVPGAEFNARLAIGGKVVRAIAIEAGRAAFAAQGVR